MSKTTTHPMKGETMLDLNLKKRVPKKPKMQPPYNKTQEQERRAKQAQHLNNKKK